MKALIGILLVVVLLQATVIPLNLLLLALVLRAYIKVEPLNLYLAFGLGLLLSFLNFSPLGGYSLLLILLVQLTHLLSKTRLSHSIWTVIPLSLIALLSFEISWSLFNHLSFEIWPKIIWETILALPIYLVIRFWEERFVVRKEIKLRV